MRVFLQLEWPKRTDTPQEASCRSLKLKCMLWYESATHQRLYGAHDGVLRNWGRAHACLSAHERSCVAVSVPIEANQVSSADGRNVHSYKPDVHMTPIQQITSAHAQSARLWSHETTYKVYPLWVLHKVWDNMLSKICIHSRVLQSALEGWSMWRHSLLSGTLTSTWYELTSARECQQVLLICPWVPDFYSWAPQRTQ